MNLWRLPTTYPNFAAVSEILTSSTNFVRKGPHPLTHWPVALALIGHRHIAQMPSLVPRLPDNPGAREPRSMKQIRKGLPHRRMEGGPSMLRWTCWNSSTITENDPTVAIAAELLSASRPSQIKVYFALAYISRIRRTCWALSSRSDWFIHRASTQSRTIIRLRRTWRRAISRFGVTKTGRPSTTRSLDSWILPDA